MIPRRKISRPLWKRSSGFPFLFFVLFLACGCGHPEPPEYYGFQNLSIGKNAAGQTTLSTTLKLYNPNHFNLTLRGGEMDVFVNDRLSGHSVLDTTIFIPRKDTFYVPVSMQINMQDILSHALISLMGRQVKVTLNGRVKLRRSGFPFSVPFHYEGEQDLNSLLQMGNGLGGSN